MKRVDRSTVPALTIQGKDKHCGSWCLFIASLVILSHRRFNYSYTWNMIHHRYTCVTVMVSRYVMSTDTTWTSRGCVIFQKVNIVSLLVYQVILNFKTLQGDTLPLFSHSGSHSHAEFLSHRCSCRKTTWSVKEWPKKPQHHWMHWSCQDAAKDSLLILLQWV